MKTHLEEWLIYGDSISQIGVTLSFGPRMLILKWSKILYILQKWITIDVDIIDATFSKYAKARISVGAKTSTGIETGENLLVYYTILRGIHPSHGPKGPAYKVPLDLEGRKHGSLGDPHP